MSTQTEEDGCASHAQKNTIELQAISLTEASRSRSAHSMTAVESSASGPPFVPNFLPDLSCL